MNFLVDAHLPRRVAHAFKEAGHDAIHTLDLPNQNRTSDPDINAVSVAEQRVVVTKDADFVNSFWLSQLPWKLLLISTGNITNKELDALLLPQLPAIVEAFETHRFLELSREALIIHA